MYYICTHRCSIKIWGLRTYWAVRALMPFRAKKKWGGVTCGLRTQRQKVNSYGNRKAN